MTIGQMPSFCCARFDADFAVFSGILRDMLGHSRRKPSRTNIGTKSWPLLVGGATSFVEIERVMEAPQRRRPILKKVARQISQDLAASVCCRVVRLRGDN